MTTFDGERFLRFISQQLGPITLSPFQVDFIKAAWSVVNMYIPPTPPPPLADQLALAILAEWKRRPWEEVHLAVLRDRLDELERHDLVKALASFDQTWFNHMRQKKATRTRTGFRSILRATRKTIGELILTERPAVDTGGEEVGTATTLPD